MINNCFNKMSNDAYLAYKTNFSAGRQQNISALSAEQALTDTLKECLRQHLSTSYLFSLSENEYQKIKKPLVSFLKENKEKLKLSEHQINFITHPPARMRDFEQAVWGKVLQPKDRFSYYNVKVKSQKSLTAVQLAVLGAQGDIVDESMQSLLAAGYIMLFLVKALMNVSLATKTTLNLIINSIDLLSNNKIELEKQINPMRELRDLLLSKTYPKEEWEIRKHHRYSPLDKLILHNVPHCYEETRGHSISHNKRTSIFCRFIHDNPEVFMAAYVPDASHPEDGVLFNSKAANKLRDYYKEIHEGYQERLPDHHFANASWEDFVVKDYNRLTLFQQCVFWFESMINTVSADKKTKENNVTMITNQTQMANRSLQSLIVLLQAVMGGFSTF